MKQDPEIKHMMKDKICLNCEYLDRATSWCSRLQMYSHVPSIQSCDLFVYDELYLTYEIIINKI
jgi:hypothetical protein